MKRSIIIAVDFDGTLCENRFPEIGKPNTLVIEDLKRLKNHHNVKLILWTNRNGEKLQQAVDWCKEFGLIFDAVNENLPEIIQVFGGDTRKIFANLYIDDRMCDRYDLSFPEGEQCDVNKLWT